MVASRPYRALPQEAEADPEPSAYDYGRGQRSLLRRFETWAILVSALCAILNIALITWSPTNSAHFNGGPTRLPRPNQYIGLERVNRKALNASSPGPIVTANLVLTQATRDGSRLRVSPMETHRKFIPTKGSVSLEDRHFVVNRTTSSLAQFRVRDWGMERCQIALNLQLAHAATGAGEGPTLLSEPPPELDIWKLGHDSEDDFIDSHTLPRALWLPRHGTSPMASLPLVIGSQVATDPFPCRADSLQTFEFACRPDNEPCFADFWQYGESATIGLYMIQHATQ